MNHANSLLKINQAAVRVYTSPKYAKRDEAGEIALHAICREFFGTIPISPRVFYKSASNDVVKAFDMVHARLRQGSPVEIWLGESKLYEDGNSAVREAITSIRAHIDAAVSVTDGRRSFSSFSDRREWYFGKHDNGKVPLPSANDFKVHQQTGIRIIPPYPHEPPSPYL